MVAVDQLVILGHPRAASTRCGSMRTTTAGLRMCDKSPVGACGPMSSATGRFLVPSTTGARRDRFVLRSDSRPRQARITTPMSDSRGRPQTPTRETGRGGYRLAQRGLNCACWDQNGCVSVAWGKTRRMRHTLLPASSFLPITLNPAAPTRTPTPRPNATLTRRSGAMPRRALPHEAASASDAGEIASLSRLLHPRQTRG